MSNITNLNKFHASGLGPTQRAREKRFLLLVWLYVWRYSCATVIACVLGVSRKCVLNFLIKIENEGLIKRVRVPGLKDPAVIMLTALGADIASQHHSVYLDYNTDSSKIPKYDLVHHFMVQMVIAQDQSRSWIEEFWSEWEFGAHGWHAEKGKRPDAIVTCTSTHPDTPGKRVAIEMEASRKSPGKMKEMAQRLMDEFYRDEPRFEAVLFYSHQDKLLAHVHTTLRREVLALCNSSKERDAWEKTLFDDRFKFIHQRCSLLFSLFWKL